MSKKTSSARNRIWIGWYKAAGIKPGAPSNASEHRRRADLDAVVNALKRYAPALYRGTRGATFDDTARENVLFALRQKTGYPQFRRRMQILIRGIEQGNRGNRRTKKRTLKRTTRRSVQRSGRRKATRKATRTVKRTVKWQPKRVPRWRIDPPPVVRLVRRPISPFSPAALAHQAGLAQIEASFVQSLDRTDDLSSEARIGQVLISATLYGGLLNRRAATALPDLLPSALHADRHQVWVDFPAAVWSPQKHHQEGLQPDEPIRRWIPDPLTQLLLLRSAEDHVWTTFRTSIQPGRRGATLWTVIKRFLRTAHKDGKTPVPYSSHADFIRAAEVRTALRIRPFLCAYARGTNESLSLPPHRWLRMRENLRTEQEVQSGIGERHGTPRMRRFAAERCNSNTASQVNLYLQLTQAIYRQDEQNKKHLRISKVRALVDDREEEFFPLLIALVDWALAGLKDKLNPGGRQRASTVHRYVTALGRSFPAYIPNREPESLSQEEYLELYERILDAPDRRAESRQMAVRQIRRFHEFLATRYGAPEIEPEAWDDNAGPTSSTAVNLITPAEYRESKHLLRQMHEGIDATVCELVMMFGYRCGLRRSECRALRLCDVQLDTREPYLYVENTLSNHLKSRSARRRIPLVPFLSPAEIGLLAEWRRAREATSGKDYRTLLFPGSDSPLRPMNAKRIFEPIHSVLRQVTGDPRVTYHTLRHAFANRIVLLLLDIDPGTDLHLKAFAESDLPDHTSVLETVIGKGRTKRAALYAVATLLGHSDPKTSLRHYIHNLDLLLAHDLKYNSPKLDAPTTASLLGCSLTRSYRLVDDKQTGQISPHRALSAYLYPHFRRRPYRSSAGRFPSRRRRPRPINQPAIPPTPEMLWANLRRVLARCPTLADLVEPPPDIPRPMAARARSALLMHDLRTRRNRPRHPLQPHRPQLHHERATAHEYWRALLSLRGRRRERAEWATRQYLHTANSRDQEARFTRLSEAKRYYAFLRDIGVPRHRIMCRHYPNGNSPLTLTRQREFWKKLTSSRLRFQARREVRYKNGHQYGTLGIVVASMPKDTGAKTPKTSNGFCYALLSWAVWIMMAPQL